MLIREVWFYFRSHKMENIIFICQLVAFFALIGTFFAFTSEAHYGKSNIEKIYKDKIIYQLIDGYVNPDEFEEFRAEPNALNILKNYYNALNNASSFQYLAMFDQSVVINDNNGNFSDESVTEKNNTSKIVAAFQLNQQACNYFNLNVVKGRVFQQSDFEDNKRALPALLGINYIDIFEVGDRLKATYYQKDVELEVIGFLQENSHVYYNGNPEFYLDQYIVLPYTNYTAPETDFDEWFQKIVYFSMINGYVSISSCDANFAQDMMMELEAISDKTGFYNYNFIGSNPNIQQYRGLINILNKNYDLILRLLILFLFINIVILSFQVYMMQERRIHIMAIHYLNGATLRDIIKQFTTEVLLLVGLAMLFGWTILMCLGLADKRIMLLNFSIAIIVTLGISLVLIYKLKNTDLMAILNQEDNVL